MPPSPTGRGCVVLSGYKPVLGLTTYLAVRRAREMIRRALVLPAGSDEGTANPLTAAGRLRAPVCLVYGERDRLVPPHFTRRLIEALPADTIIWNPLGAGHCHHADEPVVVATAAGGVHEE